MPPVTGTWYQRTAACDELAPATVWLFHSDSTPPMFVYWFCIIARKVSVSRVFPTSSGTSPGPTAQVAPVDASVGPVNVELAVLFQST